MSLEKVSFISSCPTVSLHFVCVSRGETCELTRSSEVSLLKQPFYGATNHRVEVSDYSKVIFGR